MTLDAEHALALGAGALVLGYLSFIADLNSILAWTLRLIAWAMLATVILMHSDKAETTSPMDIARQVIPPTAFAGGS